MKSATVPAPESLPDRHSRPDPKSFQARDKWIAEAAYYRAEKRGFAPGYALEDWLIAEALVDFEIARAETARARNERR
jgi:hypothetical protein